MSLQKVLLLRRTQLRKVLFLVVDHDHPDGELSRMQAAQGGLL